MVFIKCLLCATHYVEVIKSTIMINSYPDHMRYIPEVHIRKRRLREVKSFAQAACRLQRLGIISSLRDSRDLFLISLVIHGSGPQEVYNSEMYRTPYRKNQYTLSAIIMAWSRSVSKTDWNNTTFRTFCRGHSFILGPWGKMQPSWYSRWVNTEVTAQGQKQ